MGKCQRFCACLLIACIASVFPRLAFSDDITVRIALEPIEIRNQAHLRGSTSTDWTLRPSIPPSLFDIRSEIEIDNVPSYEYPRITIVSNALQSGLYDVLVGFQVGSPTNDNWNALVNDRRVLKFDFGSNSGLFRYLARSNFELRKRTTLTAGGRELTMRGQDLDVKTAQILYHHLRFWVHVSSIESFIVAPKRHYLNQSIAMLDDFSSVPGRVDEWYKQHTGISRKDMHDVIRQSRALPAAYYQQAFDSIIQFRECSQQLNLLDRLMNSFKALSREDQSIVAANFNNRAADPGPRPTEWLQRIEKAKANRAERRRMGIPCGPN